MQQHVLPDPNRHAAIDERLPTGALDSPRGLVCGLLVAFEYAYCWHLVEAVKRLAKYQVGKACYYRQLSALAL